MEEDIGAFGQFGVGVAGMMNPFYHAANKPEPVGPVQSLSRLVGEAAGAGLIAYLGAQTLGGSLVARFGPTLGRVLAEGLPLMGRDLTQDIVERDVSPGTIGRQVAFNFAVPYSIEKIAGRVLRKVPEASTAFTRVYKLEGEAFKPGEISPRTRYGMTQEKILERQLPFSSSPDMEGEGLSDIYQTAREFSYLMPGEMTSEQQFAKAVTEGKIKLTGTAKAMWDSLLPSYQQLKRLDHLMDYATPAQKDQVRWTGALASDLVQEIRRRSAQGANQRTTPILKFYRENKLTPSEAIEAVHLIEFPDMAPSSPRVREFSDIMRRELDEQGKRMAQSGVPLFDPVTGQKRPFELRPNYFPHMVDPDALGELLTKMAPDIPPGMPLTPELEVELARRGISLDMLRKRDEILIRMEQIATETGQTGKTGMALFQDMLRRHRETRASSMYVRYDFPFYKQNPIEVLPQYFEEMEHARQVYEALERPVRIPIADGADFIETNVLQVLRDNVANAGGDISTFNNIMDNILGRKPYGKAMLTISSTIRNWQLAGKMALSAFGNTAGVTNTATVFGTARSGMVLGDMLKDLVKTGSYDPADFAKRAGAVVEHGVSLIEGMDLTGPVSKLLRKYGFTQVENFLRSHAALTAKSFLEDQIGIVERGGKISDEAVRLLKKLGVPDDVFEEGVKEALLRGDVNQFLLDAGYEGARLTQFLGDVIDNPAFAASPMGKVFFQMRTFAFGQARFVKQQVFDELRKGNVKPLIRIVALGGLVGEGVSTLRDITRLRDPRSRSAEGIEALGGANFGEALRSYGKIKFPEEYDFLLNRTVDNILTAGFLGEFLEVAQASFTGRGGLATTALGPGLGEIADVMTMGLSPIDSAPKIGQKIADTALTAAALAGLPGASLAKMFSPGVATAMAQSEKARLRGIFTPQDVKGRANLSVARGKSSKARAEINEALAEGNLSRAYQLQEKHNEKMASTYIPRIGYDPRVERELTIDDQEFKHMLKKALEGPRKSKKEVRAFSI